LHELAHLIGTFKYGNKYTTPTTLTFAGKILDGKRGECGFFLESKLFGGRLAFRVPKGRELQWKFLEAGVDKGDGSVILSFTKKDITRILEGGFEIPFHPTGPPFVLSDTTSIRRPACQDEEGEIESEIVTNQCGTGRTV